MLGCKCNPGSKSIHAFTEMRFHCVIFNFWQLSPFTNMFPHIICFRGRICIHRSQEEVRTQPGSQCDTYRRSCRSAATQLWETCSWLEITFFSISASCLSPSSWLPHSPGPRVFHACCYRMGFWTHADHHTRTHQHACILSFTASFRGNGRYTSTQHNGVDKHQQKTRTLYSLISQLV